MNKIKAADTKATENAAPLDMGHDGVYKPWVAHREKTARKGNKR